ncbi:MAG: hypothetical protein GY852_10315 [bacterium]|nr:hypothetical protein [bacterium]
MVFGIGEGKIELELDGYNVSPGGKISGKLKLELNSPKKANEFRVELIGEQLQTARKMGSRERTTKKVVVFRSMQKLGGEQEYTSGEYEFELDAPPKEEPREDVSQEGLAGAIVGAAKMLKGMNPIVYSVVASLDIPMSMDINKKIRISVV